MLGGPIAALTALLRATGERAPNTTRVGPGRFHLLRISTSESWSSELSSRPSIRLTASTKNDRLCSSFLSAWRRAIRFGRFSSSGASLVALASRATALS